MRIIHNDEEYTIPAFVDLHESVEKENAKLKEELDKYRWRSVEELPENATYVWARLEWINNPKGDDILRMTSFLDGEWFYNGRTTKVTHWMPMPKFEGKK